MSVLATLVSEVTADGQIDADEVVKLREEIFADGRVDQDEADAMFKINDIVTGAANVSAYEDLFVEVISSFVLDDSESAGEIDADEAAWLVAKIEGDDQVDALEMKLLSSLKAKASAIAEPLASKMTAWGV